MTPPKSLARLLWPALLASTAACGNLNGHTDAPGLLASVQGRLSLSSSTSPSLNDVHIAVIWKTGTPGQFNVTQDLPVQPGFLNYTLPLTEPPPAAALETSSDYPGVALAGGVIVAYEDLNGNGKLDLVADDAGGFIDRIVASNSNLALTYFQSDTGALPPIIASLPSPPTLGYNMITPACTPVEGGFLGPDGGLCYWNVFLPISTPYDLIFSDDPALNSLMCGTDGVIGASSPDGVNGPGTYWDVDQQGTPPGGYPEAGALNLSCYSNSEYMLWGCAYTQVNLCTVENVCMGMTVTLGDASAPPGWPCP